MVLEADDLEVIEDMINQKVDGETLVLREDLGAQINDLREAVQWLMDSLEAMK